MRIIWYGHSCFRLEFANSVVLIDPFLEGNPTFQASGISFEAATKGVTHVAVTHGHDDHIGSAGRICKEQGATLFANYEVAMHVSKAGASKLEPMNTGGTVAAADFELTLTQALHSSSSNNVYLGNPNGIVIHPKTGPTVYHMGDTDLFSSMALIEELYQPKIGIVPIGDRFTMGAKTAAFAVKKFFNFKTVLPCHYGTFPVLDQTADKFVSAMAPKPVTVPKIGVAISV